MAADSTEPHPAWRRYRLWRFALWTVFFTFLPGPVLVALVARQFTSSDVPVTVAALAWMAAWTVCAVRVAWARCPRCGHRVHRRRSLGWNPFSRRCLSCGLEIGRDPGDP